MVNRLSRVEQSRGNYAWTINSDPTLTMTSGAITDGSSLARAAAATVWTLDFKMGTEAGQGGRDGPLFTRASQATPVPYDPRRLHRVVASPKEMPPWAFVGHVAPSGCPAQPTRRAAGPKPQAAPTHTPCVCGRDCLSTAPPDDPLRSTRARPPAAPLGNAVPPGSTPRIQALVPAGSKAVLLRYTRRHSPRRESPALSLVVGATCTRDTRL